MCLQQSFWVGGPPTLPPSGEKRKKKRNPVATKNPSSSASLSVCHFFPFLFLPRRTKKKRSEEYCAASRKNIFSPFSAKPCSFVRFEFFRLACKKERRRGRRHFSDRKSGKKRRRKEMPKGTFPCGGILPHIMKSCQSSIGEGGLGSSWAVPFGPRSREKSHEIQQLKSKLNFKDGSLFEGKQ